MTQLCRVLCLLQRVVDICSCKILDTTARINFICNRSKLKTTQMSFSGWSSPYRRILFSNTKQRTVDIYLEGSQGNYAVWKKSILIRLYTIWFHFKILLKWQNFRDGEQTRNTQVLGRGGEREVAVNIKG